MNNTNMRFIAWALENKSNLASLISYTHAYINKCTAPDPLQTDIITCSPVYFSLNMCFPTLHKPSER